MITRRTFLCGLTLGTLHMPLAAGAQPVGKVYRVGILADKASDPGEARLWQAFRLALRERGWIEGKNLLIAEARPQVKAEFKKALALKSQIPARGLVQLKRVAQSQYTGQRNTTHPISSAMMSTIPLIPTMRRPAVSRLARRRATIPHTAIPVERHDDDQGQDHAEREVQRSDPLAFFAHRARGLPGTRRGMSYPAAAWTSTPSRALRRAAKRSETAGGTVDRLTGTIRARGFCSMRFAHIRA